MLPVTFERQPEKHCGACQYAVLLGGMKVGWLLREYEQGWVAVRGAVGGSCPGQWRWYFEPTEDFAEWMRKQHWESQPRWWHLCDWHLQAEARAELAAELPFESAWAIRRALRGIESALATMRGWAVAA